MQLTFGQGVKREYTIDFMQFSFERGEKTATIFYKGKLYVEFSYIHSKIHEGGLLTAYAVRMGENLEPWAPEYYYRPIRGEAPFFGSDCEERGLERFFDTIQELFNRLVVDLTQHVFKTFPL